MTPAKREDIQRLKRFLDTQGYDEKTLTAQLGQAWPPAPGQAETMLEKSREITALNVLIRLFLLGIRVDVVAIREFVPTDIIDFCLQNEILEECDDAFQARVVIVPIEDLLFASDAFRLLGTSDAGEFVLPASTHSANFLRYVTIKAKVSKALDLGCGCGIHALFAARHCERVIATDISRAALHYTAFNAALNQIDNVECAHGSLFDPVESETFDLIISNPPFVLSPSSTFVYRDNAMELDEFCRVLVEAAPQYLRAGGHLQMLCEWVELPDQSLADRISSWVRGCDAWILHATPLSPQQYVATRTADILGDSVDAGPADEWLNYLTERQVRFVHPGMMVLRKRTAPNWLHIQNLSGDVVNDAGAAILDGIAAVDFLESCDDESLLDAVFGHAERLTAEAGNSDGEHQLRINNGLLIETTVDASVAGFLQCFDKQKSTLQCIQEFARLIGSDSTELTPELLGLVRVFVSRGFLIPFDFD